MNSDEFRPSSEFDAEEFLLDENGNLHEALTIMTRQCGDDNHILMKYKLMLIILFLMLVISLSVRISLTHLEKETVSEDSPQQDFI